MAFQDASAGAAASAMRYSNTVQAWAPLGPYGFSGPEAVTDTRLAVDTQNRAWVAFIELGRPVVMRR